MVSRGTLNVWKVTFPGVVVSLVSVYCRYPQRADIVKKSDSESTYGEKVKTVT